jgi:hypothetical protein
MKKYRCYLFDAGFHIISMKIIESKDDDGAARTCQAVFASSACSSVELWDGPRRLASWSRVVGGSSDRMRATAPAFDGAARAPACEA